MIPFFTANRVFYSYNLSVGGVAVLFFISSLIWVFLEIHFYYADYICHHFIEVTCDHETTRLGEIFLKANY